MKETLDCSKQNGTFFFRWEVAGLVRFCIKRQSQDVELIYFIFQIDHGVALHILVFIPVAILGVLGGIFGAVFTFVNLKV
jgi:hypothetical protein